ncbi:hypothetical protein B0H15DRAFT_861558 [Mycena belliarum]|uniref:Uncharacterized protein n=1 Tax=Mycena belliarum TaxID=1033014 RepID=A0AAD6TS09_9AGAR|nr:hypothetical protein B0H15DRAFT_861558 [Mycena belliae]
MHWSGRGRCDGAYSGEGLASPGLAGRQPKSVTRTAMAVGRAAGTCCAGPRTWERELGDVGQRGQRGRGQGEQHRSDGLAHGSDRAHTAAVDFQRASGRNARNANGHAAAAPCAVSRVIRAMGYSADCARAGGTDRCARLELRRTCASPTLGRMRFGGAEAPGARRQALGARCTYIMRREAQVVRPACGGRLPAQARRARSRAGKAGTCAQRWGRDCAPGPCAGRRKCVRRETNAAPRLRRVVRHALDFVKLLPFDPRSHIEPWTRTRTRAGGCDAGILGASVDLRVGGGRPEHSVAGQDRGGGRVSALVACNGRGRRGW